MVSKQLIHKFFLAVIFLLNIVTIRANNIAVSNVSVTGQNTSAGANNVANFSLVQFNLSWENSWRTSSGPSNWDAAWVFVKFRVGASNPAFTGVSSSGTTITVSSTNNLRVGMPVRVTSGTGAFADNTVINNIISATQFVVSAAPSTALSGASIECIRIWEHALLNNIGHTAPSGSVIDVGLRAPDSAFNATSNPVLGTFIYRSAYGSGTNTFNNIRLRWNYGANRINDNIQVTVQVFAIEMVLVPPGSFFVGSGGTESGSFTNGSWTSGATIPFQITSENALAVNQSSGSLWGTSASGNSSIGPAGTIASAYPKGFAAFYCMKYEITQGQYRDFLNTLTYTQQLNRTFSLPNSAAGTGALSSTNANRHGIDIQTPGIASVTPAVYGCNLNGNSTYNDTLDGEWIACNLLSWMDGCAYLDWAGLRPMTELEFEKACRGNQAAVAGEYAWGSTAATAANNISKAGSSNEFTNTQFANAAFENQSNVTGPLRVGSFAGTATTRAKAGATYYGIMEMSGNLWERIVTIGNTAGRSYTGLHGNGNLLPAGSADVNFWPGINGNAAVGSSNLAFGGLTGVTQAAGSGFRGADWSSSIPAYMCVSARILASYTESSRISSYGFRGVRTAQQIITSGLTLHLDAGNPSSYPGSGTTWTDLSGNGNNGTLTNGPAFNTANGGTLALDGTNDYIDCGNNSSFNSSSITQSVFFRFTNTASGISMLLAKNLGTGVLESYGMWWDPSKFNAVISTGQQVNFNQTPTVNQWYQLVHTFDNTTKVSALYLNGVLVQSSTLTGSTITYDNRILTIGSEFENNVMSFFFSGNIAQVMLYNRALTAQEIQYNFNILKSRFGY